MVAIQNQIQKSCLDILSLQESLKVIQKIYSCEDFSLNNLKEISSDNPNQLYKNLKSNFLLLQEEQNKLFINTENFYKEVREELMHKQVLQFFLCSLFLFCNHYKLFLQI